MFKTFLSLLSVHASYCSDKSSWYPLDLQLNAPYTGFIYIYIFGRKSNLYRESNPFFNLEGGPYTLELRSHKVYEFQNNIRK